MVASEECPQIIVLLVGDPEEYHQKENAGQASQGSAALSTLFLGQLLGRILRLGSILALAGGEDRQCEHHKPGRELESNFVRQSQVAPVVSDVVTDGRHEKQGNRRAYIDGEVEPQKCGTAQRFLPRPL